MLDKRTFYQQPGVVAEYDQLRFGGPGGAWVNERELGLVEELLPPSGRVLDLGAGTGRLSRRLAERAYGIVALDTSAEMLKVTQSAAIPAVQADGFSLPFQVGAFDAVVALRVAFHYADLSALFQAARAVLRPGGRLIFDTYRWTPRALFALDATRWGGKCFVHSAERVAQAANGAGLRIIAEQPAFLFSPYLYRRLPEPLIRGLAALEEACPGALRARTFWSLMATEPEG